jgi:hypothetical protein
LNKKDFVAKAKRVLLKYGQDVKVHLFDTEETFNIPKTEDELPDEDIDIFSTATDPANDPIDEPETNTTKIKYKTAKTIKALITIDMDETMLMDGGNVQGENRGDLFTLSEQLVGKRLPMDEDSWTNAYIEYTEFNKVVKKKVNRIVFDSRWGNEALGVSIYFEKDVNP